VSALGAGARRSTIMDTNSFRPEHAAALDARTRRLTERREHVLGESYRLFYREPVHLVRGRGAHLWDAEGRQYLDMYNNVPSIGHAHPAVVAAVHEQMTQLNIHTRYLHERILDYSDELLSTMPAALDRVMYLCTGSEANDLAIRVARAATGGRAIIVTREAYHGNTELVSAHSPSLGSGQTLDPDVILVDPPDGYRQRVDDLGSWFADAVRQGIERSEARGVRVAALLMDSMFSSDGVFPATAGDLTAAVAVVRAHGGVVIADEVQPGFGRTGEAFWGFGRHGLVPEIVTLGKPMGNGRSWPPSAITSRISTPSAGTRYRSRPLTPPSGSSTRRP
jgi:4-aminobutyrate aminotransferase-like enzyme